MQSPELIKQTLQSHARQTVRNTKVIRARAGQEAAGQAPAGTAEGSQLSERAESMVAWPSTRVPW